MRFPWISREHHEDVVAALKAHIRLFEEQNLALLTRLDAPVNVKVELPELLNVPQQLMRRPKRTRQGDGETPERPFDWSLVDVNDDSQMAILAIKELGGPASPYVLAQTVDRIKRHVHSAKQKKALEILQNGQVGTIEVPTPKVEDPEKHVPDHIRDLVAAAEKV